MGSRTLVTGGAGFIGSHLCDRLIADGHTVVCVDDLSSGSTANLTALTREPRFTFVQADVVAALAHSMAGPPAVAALGLGPFDRLYHLACPASPARYQSKPADTARVCVLGTLAALEAAKAWGARMFLASTSEVYGDPEVHPQPESYRGRVNVTGPRACYDEGKRMSETFCEAYRVQHAVDARIGRIFNTYGPRTACDDGRAVSNLVVQALRGEPLTVYGSGEQTRSFCYVSDMVEGVVRLMEYDGAGADAGPMQGNGPPAGGPVNLGNPHEVTVRQLAAEISSLCGGDGAVIHSPLPVDDPSRRRPDIDRAAELLGWRPTVSLREGLTETIAYFRLALGDAPGGGEHSVTE